MHRLIVLLLRLIGTVAGLALLLVGLPLLISPIPVGLLLIVLGVAVLIASSMQVRSWVRRQRARDKRFDADLRRLEDRMPGLIRALLASTRPADEA